MSDTTNSHSKTATSKPSSSTPIRPDSQLHKLHLPRTILHFPRRARNQDRRQIGALLLRVVHYVHGIIGARCCSGSDREWFFRERGVVEGKCD